MSDVPLGEAEWIRRVLDQHEAALLRYAVRLCGDADQARDVVQETFLRLCQAERGAVDGHIGPWLFRVCRQRAFDAQRKEKRMPLAASHTLNGHSSGAQSPAARMELQDDAHELLRALTELPTNQQEVVHLKFQAGLSYREISDVTGLSVSNVGFLLHTALTKLRARFAAVDAAAADTTNPLIATPHKTSGRHQ